MTHTAFFALALALAAAPAMAQTSKTPAKKTSSTSTGTGSTKKAAPQKTTLSGIYTLEEADAGKELYGPLCASCHLTANPHNAPEFRKKWMGKPLSELLTLMRTTMPKNEPGSLSDEDYGVILAYMLQMNKMPSGKTYLSTDTLELRKIRFDTVRTMVRKP